MPTQNSTFSHFIHQTLIDVNQIAVSSFGKVTSTTKTGDNNQVLTETDLAIGKSVIELIEKQFPDHNIIDEEKGIIDKKSDFTWVVDPIDGTSNFANGVPTYGIMVGLLKGNQPWAGGIALPAFNQVFTAEKNEGTWCNGEQVHVTAETELLKTLVSYCIDGHQENPEITYQETKMLADVILGIRNLRTSGSAFDMIMVTTGKYGGYLNRTSKIWDNVAPHIIIEEAGGVFTDFWGQPMDYSDPLSRAEQNFTSCAAAPDLHRQLQAIIHQHD